MTVKFKNMWFAYSGHMAAHPMPKMCVFVSWLLFLSWKGSRQDYIKVTSVAEARFASSPWQRRTQQPRSTTQCCQVNFSNLCCVNVFPFFALLLHSSSCSLCCCFFSFPKFGNVPFKRYGWHSRYVIFRKEKPSLLFLKSICVVWHVSLLWNNKNIIR